MMDQSGSMSDTVPGGSTKWEAVKQALATFVGDPINNGTSVGIQFFGQPAGGGTPPPTCMKDADCGAFGPCLQPFGICQGAGGGDSCNESDYAKPFVEIQPLPGVAASINSAMNGHSPMTSTPTEPALRGLIAHASEWQKAHPNRVTVGILITDGLPTECTIQDGPGLQAIAAAAYNGSPKIRTAVIGILGSADSPTILDDIAIGGGTANICPGANAACILDTTQPASNSVAKQLEVALQAIQAQAIGCP
jgi:hypothetical protein